MNKTVEQLGLKSIKGQANGMSNVKGYAGKSLEVIIFGSNSKCQPFKESQQLIVESFFGLNLSSFLKTLTITI